MVAPLAIAAARFVAAGSRAFGVSAARAFGAEKIWQHRTLARPARLWRRCHRGTSSNIGRPRPWLAGDRIHHRWKGGRILPLHE
jgi:hypothetical protein